MEESTSPPAIGGNRLRWDDLPSDVRERIEQSAGSRVVSASSQEGGFSPGLASRVLLENGQRTFVKAISTERQASGPATLRLESEIASALPAGTPAPKLLWTLEHESWVALIFEDVDGVQPAQPWEQTELERVLDAVATLAELMTPSPIDVPSILNDEAHEFTTWRRWASELPDVDLSTIDPWLEDNIALLTSLEAGWEDAAEGNTLLHCDLRADNILLTDTNVYFVDWPSACVGAPWLDLLFMLPSMAINGVDPEPILQSHSVFENVATDTINSAIATIAGFFMGRSVRHPVPLLPTLRHFQRVQGQAALRLLRQRLS